jgi:hypothetical protein
MMRLYIDIDGVLIAPVDGDGPFGLALKEHVDEFLEWATLNFDCYWLSGWAVYGNMSLINEKLLYWLPPVAKTIKVARWGYLKTEALEGRNWIWIDDELLDEEKEILEKHKLLDHFIHVDVTEPSLRLVMGRIQQVQETL